MNLSSCRAEYIARSVNCAQEIRCVQQVTTEVLGVKKEAVLQSSFLIIWHCSLKGRISENALKRIEGGR